LFSLPVVVIRPADIRMIVSLIVEPHCRVIFGYSACIHIFIKNNHLH